MSFCRWQARRRREIQDGSAVSCEKCRALKDMGAPRPDCRECGRPELSLENRVAWLLFLEYREALIAPGGPNGFTVNVDGVRYIAGRFGIEDSLMFLRSVLIMARELLGTVTDSGDTDG